MAIRKRTVVIAAAGILAVGMPAVRPLPSQQPSFRRTILRTQDLSVPGREAVMAIAEFQPGGVAPRHVHAGEEIGYVLEGTAILEVEGEPPATLKEGDTFFIDAGRVHGARNAGTATARILGLYVVEKGRPLASPAP